MRYFLTIFMIITGLALAQNPGNIGTANLTAWFNSQSLANGNVTNWTTSFPVGAPAITVSDATAPYPQATNTPAGDVSNYNTTIEFSNNSLTNLQALENTANLDLLDNFAAGDQGTFFCAYYLPAASTNNHMMLYNEAGTNTDAIQFRNLGATGRLAIGKAPTNTVNACRNWVENFEPTIISYKGNRSGVATMQAYESSLLFTASSASQSSGATGLYFGIMPGNANSPFNGYLHEFIFYNTDLNVLEMAKVHTYLAIKYGITLDNTGGGGQGDYISTAGALVWDASITPNYHHNVIGIARDDSQGLNQKQSHAFDDSHRLYIGNLAATNVGNTSTFSSDISYVTLGDNQGIVCATPASNAEVPAAPALFSRLEREWKVRKTNFSQNFGIDIQLDPCATPANFEFDCMRLLVDDDGDFTNATVFDATSGLNFSYNSNGMVSVTGISNIHIPDNSIRYITLGSVNLPTANLGNDTLLCQGASLNLDVTTLGASYLWQDNSTNPTFTVNTAGTYWVEVSNGFCTYRDTIDVTYFNPNANIGNDTTLCQGATLTLDATQPGASYLWQDNSTNPTYTVISAGQYYVDVSINGCATSDTINVAYNPLFDPNLGADTALCQGATLTLDATQAGATYLWHDNSTNPNFTVNAPGTFWVEVSNGNCNFTDSIDVSYITLAVDLGNDTTLCQGQTLVLTATQPGASYIWQDNSINPTFTVNSAGQYFVEVTLNGCSVSDTINVTYNPLPTPNLGPDTTLCQGQTLLLDAFETNATYLWQDNSTNQNFSVNSAGNYAVQVTVNGCTASDNINVNYTILPVVNLGNDTVLCPSESLLLSVTNANATYLWQDNSTNAGFTVTNAGQYYVDVTRGNCTVSDTINVSYYGSLGIIILNPDTVCVNELVNFTHNVPSANLSSSVWDFGGLATSNNFVGKYAFSDPGNYNITLTAENVGGCEEIFYSTIVVIALPTASFYISPESPLKQEVVEFTNISIDADSYLWEFGDGTSSDDINPLHAYEKPGSYQAVLTVSNSHCSANTSVNVEVRDELLLYVPNSFTPENGGLNNRFEPVFTSGFDPYKYHLMIFNRNGEIIFESFDATVGWDGKYGNELAQQGVYIWAIEFDNYNNTNRTKLKGYFTLLR